MRLISRLPVNIDYILGVLMISAGVFITVNDGWAIVNQSLGLLLLTIDLAPYVELILGGVFMMTTAHGSLRRTIWVTTLILGVNALLSGGLYIEAICDIIPAIGYDNPYFVYYFALFSTSLISIGCAVALIVNSVMFATRRVSSIYPSIIAVILCIAADLLTLYVRMSYEPEMLNWAFYAVYVPHMVLFLVYALLFTSDEVSWYTAKGDMLKALNRLKTSYGSYDVPVITRDQLIVLMQSSGSYVMRLRRDRYMGLLEVDHVGDRTFMSFGKYGSRSMAGALHFELEAVVLPDSMSRSRYVDIYAVDGMHIRLEVTEPRRRRARPDIFGSRTFHGVLENYRYTVSNASLYRIVEGEGDATLMSIGSPNFVHLNISGTGADRVASIVRYDKAVLATMKVVAVVPVSEYGAYTKLYVYGESGRYWAFKVARPAPWETVRKLHW